MAAPCKKRLATGTALLGQCSVVAICVLVCELPDVWPILQFPCWDICFKTCNCPWTTLHSRALANVYGVFMDSLQWHFSLWLCHDSWGAEPTSVPGMMRSGADRQLAAIWSFSTVKYCRFKAVLHPCKPWASSHAKIAVQTTWNKMAGIVLDSRCHCNINGTTLLCWAIGKCCCSKPANPAGPMLLQSHAPSLTSVWTWGPQQCAQLRCPCGDRRATVECAPAQDRGRDTARHVDGGLRKGSVSAAILSVGDGKAQGHERGAERPSRHIASLRVVLDIDAEREQGIIVSQKPICAIC